METLFLFYSVRWLHLAGVVLVLGFSLAGAVLSRSKSKNLEETRLLVQVQSRFAKIILYGLLVAIISGLIKIFTISAINHPIFDIKMTILLITLVLAGYINHNLLPKMRREISATESTGDSDVFMAKFKKLQVFSLILWIIIASLGVIY